MGYLNNKTVTVDAILTKKGRELLARNDGSFRITQFSLSDDEVDYLLTNSTFEASGYVATIGDSRTLANFEGVGVNTSDVAVLNATQTIGTNVSRTVIGTTINLTATTVNTLFGSASTLNTILTVTGRDSGARLTIPINITKITT